MNYRFKVVLAVLWMSSITLKTDAFNLRISPLGRVSSSGKAGFLEFQQGSQWFRICNSTWGLTEAHVACGQLGYPRTENAAGIGAVFHNSDLIQMKDVVCNGVESRLSECRHQNLLSNPLSTRCESRKAVIIKCLPLEKNTNKTIRLKAGALVGEGRVQVVRFAKWGAVCGNKWNSVSANVACRQLGFGTAKSYYTSTIFGRGHGAIWYTNVVCQGNETQLRDCSYDLVINKAYYNNFQGVGCSQFQLASVKCFTPDTGAKYLIDLVGKGSAKSLSGRVIVKTSPLGEWRSISSDHWTLREAAVACRQLEYGYGYKALKNATHSTTDTRGLTKSMIRVQCNGNEATLTECKHSIVSNSKNSSGDSYVAAPMAGIQCTNVLPDLQVDVDHLRRSITLEYQPLKKLQCAGEEGCLSSSATPFLNKTQYERRVRALLRFTTSAWNRGTADFRSPQTADQWEFHQCHNHYHSMQEFSHYDLLSAQNVKVAEGHKASFCLGDSRCDRYGTRRYLCTREPTKNKQGISVGCTDLYNRKLDCQWIDITNVRRGQYILRVSINPLENVAETDFNNNDVVCDLDYSYGRVSVKSCYMPDDFVLS